MTLLHCTDVSVTYTRRRRAPVQAVVGASLTIEPGEIVGLVGETGCGKSSLGRAIVGLTPVAGGSVHFKGVAVPPPHRGRRAAELLALQLVFQNPTVALNPRRRVGAQIADGVQAGRGDDRSDRGRQVAELLARVGLSSDLAGRYPHELSGGQRQRVTIARALALDPEVLVLDEPLASLDASAQAYLTNTLVELCRDSGVAVLLISHDLAIVRYAARRIVVMYLGQIVEEGATDEVWNDPRHPYTKALIGAVPVVGAVDRLPEQLSGDVPDPAHPPTGCRFHPRCPVAEARCSVEEPLLTIDDRGRGVRCLLVTPTGTQTRSTTNEC